MATVGPEPTVEPESVVEPLPGAVIDPLPVVELEPDPVNEPEPVAEPLPVVEPEPEPVVVAEPEPSPEADEERFTSGRAVIRPGDNLWSISRRVYGSGSRYREIVRANRGIISNPNVIFPGQVLVLPAPETTLQDPALPGPTEADPAPQ